MWSREFRSSTTRRSCTVRTRTYASCYVREFGMQAVPGAIWQAGGLREGSVVMAKRRGQVKPRSRLMLRHCTLPYLALASIALGPYLAATRLCFAGRRCLSRHTSLSESGSRLRCGALMSRCRRRRRRRRASKPYKSCTGSESRSSPEAHRWWLHISQATAADVAAVRTCTDRYTNARAHVRAGVRGAGGAGVW